MLILTAMDNHDSAYRLLFSHPEMVRDLLIGFVPQRWISELDMSTLEKVSGSCISDDLRSRSSDVIWRVRWGDEWLYIYLLLEFQSSVDPFMAVRMMTYVGLLYQDLIRSGQLDDQRKLPPVLPVVLYNGTRRWRAATDVRDLIGHAPDALDAHLPSMRYLLLDEGAWDEDELRSLHNLVAAVFRLENSRTPADIQEILVLLIDWLRTPDQEGLRRSITEWLRRIILPGRLPDDATLSELHDLQEMHSMLAENLKKWEDDLRRQALAEGLAKGASEGKALGKTLEARKILQRQLQRRFGPLPGWAQQKLDNASLETLEHWADLIIDAPDLEAALL